MAIGIEPLNRYPACGGELHDGPSQFTGCCMNISNKTEYTAVYLKKPYILKLEKNKAMRWKVSQITILSRDDKSIKNICFTPDQVANSAKLNYWNALSRGHNSQVAIT